MQKVKFEKMHGIGNDFVLIDTRMQLFDVSIDLIVSMADRHTGIGFNQLLLVDDSTVAGCDAAYRFFNPDGSQAEQCGNGQRCISLYLHQQNPSQKSFCISGLAGKIHSKIIDDNLVEVNMGGVQSIETLSLDGQQCHHVIFANPHLVTTAKKISSCDLDNLHTRFSHSFTEGINFELAEITDKDNIKLRVHERGTGETMACGSGACAAVFALYSNNQLNNRVSVALPGGTLLVECNQQNKNIYLTGPAQHVFSGEIRL